MTTQQGIWSTAAILLLVDIGFIIAGAYLYHYYTKGKRRSALHRHWALS